jgi:hypothetical protein
MKKKKRRRRKKNRRMNKNKSFFNTVWAIKVLSRVLQNWKSQ